MSNSVSQSSSRLRRQAIFRAWLIVLFWFALIFYFSAQPSLGTDWGIWDLILRKLAHITEFGVLNLLLWRALKLSLPNSRALALSSILALLYAASDELHQRFTTGRSASGRDVLIDAVGIALAAILILGYRRRQERF